MILGKSSRPGATFFAHSGWRNECAPIFLFLEEKKRCRAAKKRSPFWQYVYALLHGVLVPLPPRAKELAPQGETFLLLAPEAKTLL